jgi:hypothetical protein
MKKPLFLVTAISIFFFSFFFFSRPQAVSAACGSWDSFGCTTRGGNLCPGSRDICCTNVYECSSVCGSWDGNGCSVSGGLRCSLNRDRCCISEEYCPVAPLQQCGLWRDGSCSVVGGSQCSGLNNNKCCLDLSQCLETAYDPSDTDTFSQSFAGFIKAISPNFNVSMLSIDGIIGSLLPLLFVLAGIILLFMLIFGGFTLLTAATNPDRAQKGKQILTMALGGFLLIFTSIWIAQIIGFVFGIKIFEP